MLTTQDTIDALTTRIESAYRLRCPKWHGGCSSSRVWAVAVSRLIEANDVDACIPIDPELYVASQGMNSSMTDPWTGLTSAESVRRYKDRVNVIVRGLRDELTEEVRVAERRILAGQSVCQVLTSKSGRISVLGRYIVAVRASRERLARRFLEGAVEQHRACPLYRHAAAGLIPSTAYPIAEGHEVASPPDLRMVGILGRAIVYRN